MSPCFRETKKLYIDILHNMWYNAINETQDVKGGDLMVCKTKDDSKLLGTQMINLTQVIDELIRWRKDVSRERDEWGDPVRLAMIDSFEDIILNAVVED